MSFTVRDARVGLAIDFAFERSNLESKIEASLPGLLEVAIKKDNFKVRVGVSELGFEVAPPNLWTELNDGPSIIVLDISHRLPSHTI
ncbi:hypothetical protein ABW20_dc0106581 [Dactylellina cionopaga]|nr:hypothetical protein ABW20_dc0106581 [Dactylellina cionopaga]